MSKNRLDYQAQLSRHSHDISAGYSASMTTGQIIPQYFHVLGPGDTIYFQPKMFSRLQDPVTAFLGEIDCHIDTFFVPLQMLYTPFGSVFAQTQDLLSSLYANIENDSFPLFDLDRTLVQKSNDESDSLIFRECIGKEHARLLDAFDLNPYSVLSSDQKQATDYEGSSAIDEVLTHNGNISPWILAAYQAIYQKYYRNDEIERFDIRAFNFDKFYEDDTFVETRMFTLRHVNRLPDYFTHVRVSPISSAVNNLYQQDNPPFPTNGGDLNSMLAKVNNFLEPRDSSNRYATFNSSLGTAYETNKSFDSVSVTQRQVNDLPEYEFLNTANIRTLFAVDKFARIYGRADKTYDDQILAHFGIHIPHDVKHDITHLKHFHVSLMSDPVYGTSNVENAQGDMITTLGQVGGQGSCTLNGSQDKFTAPVHGVFMCVAYFVVKPRYFGTFSKLHLLTNRLSFPIPEFDKLGAQPLYAFEANPAYLTTDTKAIRIGWQNRYAQFKEKYNRACMTYFGGDYGHGVLNSNIYAPWILSRMPFGSLGYSELGTTSKFVDANLLFEPVDSLNVIMNREFVKGWSNTWYEQPHLMFQSDPILTEFYANAKVVSWMSETGEPDL